MHRNISILVLIFALAAACGGDSPQRSAPTGTLLITNVTILQRTDSPPLENGAVLIRGNRIERVGPADRVSVPNPGDIGIVDGQGGTLIPGLWDMHTHVLWQPLVEDGFLRLFLVNGVTGIRDMGGTLETLQTVRPGGRHDSPLNPKIVAAGPWLNQIETDPARPLFRPPGSFGLAGGRTRAHR